MSSAFPPSSLNNLPARVSSRRLLLHAPLYEPGTPIPGPVLSDPGTPESSMPASAFDANVVMILAVLLCALIFALGLNSIVRCALRCSSRIGLGTEPGQAVGLATAGLRRRALRAIPALVFSPDLKLLGSGTECAICLSDLVPGERIRVLPKCNHGFHVRCIDRWLMARSSCPTCRQCLFATAQKILACRDANGADTDAGTVHSIIVPLEPEGYVHNRRELVETRWR